MNRSAITTVVAVVAAFGVGLTWSFFTGSSHGSVAIVDLDEVARRIGRDKEMVESVQTQASALNSQLIKIQNQANQELSKFRAGLNEDQQVTNEEAQQYVRVQRSAQVKLSQIQQQAKVGLNQHRQQLVSQFRKDAQPIAAKIAKERGFDSVITRNDTVVFSFDEAVDITDDVVKLMSAEMPARPAKKTAPKATKPPVKKSGTPAATAAAPAPSTTN